MFVTVSNDNKIVSFVLILLFYDTSMLFCELFN